MSLMSFVPPSCPRPACRFFPPTADFRYQRCGSFRRRCDGRVVQRFRCLACQHTFSVQTFRLDYRQHRPGLNQAIFEALVSKVSHRQTARILCTKRATVERRLRLFGAHALELHQLLLADKHLRGSFSLDEAESFETDRRLKPLTLPVLIERSSRFILHLSVAPLAARTPLSGRLEQRRQELVAVEGRRKSGSREAVKGCLEVLRERTQPTERLRVVTDRKASYPALLKEVFGERELVHTRTSSKERRDEKNPLFAINHTLAMLRDGVSRLVRRTWAHAKLGARLALHLWIYAAWRNLVRGVTNKRRRETPAMALGIDPEPWSVKGLLRWRARFALSLRAQ
jgi:transposase-like protein